MLLGSGGCQHAYAETRGPWELQAYSLFSCPFPATDCHGFRAGSKTTRRVSTVISTACVHAHRLHFAFQFRLVASPTDRSAEELMNLVLDTNLSKLLCSCLEAARSASSGSSGAPAAASSALRALASLVHCPSEASATSSLATHFPLAASASGQGSSKAEDGYVEPGVSPQDANRAAVAETLERDTQAIGAVRASLVKVIEHLLTEWVASGKRFLWSRKVL